MKRVGAVLIVWLLLLPLLFVMMHDNVQGSGGSFTLETTGARQRYTEAIPKIDVREFGHVLVPISVDETVADLWPEDHLQRGGGSDPSNPYAVIRQSGPTFIAPGGVARYAIKLANYESVTHTYRLTDTLPAGLAYISGSADVLTYDADERTLSWQGSLAPGNLDYLIEESPIALPYLDLAEFGVGDLCAGFIASGDGCDDVTVTFNLGVNGYTANLYGGSQRQLTLSSDGLLFGDEGAVPDTPGHNRWLPDERVPGTLLAGLWRDGDMGGAGSDSTGRWHAAIVSGLVAGHDLFYAQWHDAAHAGDPNLTARHAIAVVLNRDSNPSAPSLTGQAFFIYDNISDPEQLVSRGYTIGVADKLGLRGATHAYARCCDEVRPPQGYPPAAGTTLRLRPVLFGADSGYRRTFHFEAVVTSQVPATLVNTVSASSRSADPALANVWSSHYMHMRMQNFLPLLHSNKVSP